MSPSKEKGAKCHHAKNNSAMSPDSKSSRYCNEDDDHLAPPTGADLNKPIAERKQKRDLTEQKKQTTQLICDEHKRHDSQPKKSKERGWYKVEGITGHRIVRAKNKDHLELRVKWEDYSEPTWEAFNGFVKDTAPMVGRYLLKKSLMRPLHAYSELKRLKTLDLKASDPLTAAQAKELKAQFAGFKQFLLSQTGNGVSPNFMGKNASQSSKGS